MVLKNNRMSGIRNRTGICHDIHRNRANVDTPPSGPSTSSRSGRYYRRLSQVRRLVVTSAELVVLLFRKTVLLQMTVVNGMRGQMTAEVICRLVELSSVLIRHSRRGSVCFLCKKMGRSWMIQKSIP